MSTRAEMRRQKKNEKKYFKELLKSTHHFLGDIWTDLNDIEDPRDIRYIEYSNNVMLTVPIIKNICDIRSMQEMTRKFNQEECIKNISTITENSDLEEIPHYVTINDYLSKLNPEGLMRFRTGMIKKLLRKRSFEDSRFLNKYWLIIVDATQLFSFSKEHCKSCLTKTFNKGTKEEKTIYYHNVLEAKIILGEDFVVSIATEFIENDGENAERQQGMNEEEIKQDCEIRAFERLAEKLKKAFTRLPICIMGDSLYASETIFQICDKNEWKYMIRFKDGSIKSVAEEFHKLKEKEHKNIKIIKDKKTKEEQGKMKWVNHIGYNKREVNVMEYIYKENEEEHVFQWITNIEITKDNVKKFAKTGRKRWKIENQGFNIQKNYRYDITHVNSKNYNAMKNHYLIIQIADIILQLYEKGMLILKELKKTIKDISSDLLATFKQELTREDISHIKKRTLISIP